MKRRMVLEKCLEKEEGSEKQKEVASFSSRIWVSKRGVRPSPGHQMAKREPWVEEFPCAFKTLQHTPGMISRRCIKF